MVMLRSNFPDGKSTGQKLSPKERIDALKRHILESSKRADSIHAAKHAEMEQWKSVAHARLHLLGEQRKKTLAAEREGKEVTRELRHASKEIKRLQGVACDLDMACVKERVYRKEVERALDSARKTLFGILACLAVATMLAFAVSTANASAHHVPPTVWLDTAVNTVASILIGCAILAVVWGLGSAAGKWVATTTRLRSIREMATGEVKYKAIEEVTPPACLGPRENRYGGYVAYDNPETMRREQWINGHCVAHVSMEALATLRDKPLAARGFEWAYNGAFTPGMAVGSVRHLPKPLARAFLGEDGE